MRNKPAEDSSPPGDGTPNSRPHGFDINAATSAIPLMRYLGVRTVPPSAPEVTVSLEMDRTDDVLNPTGIPHGGAIAALIDHAGGLAVGVALGHSGPTGDLHIRFLRIADGSPIRADATVLRTGRRLAIAEVRVYGQSGKLSAVGTMSTAPMPKARSRQDDP